MQDKYVSDIIADDYKGWKQGDVILLNTPTGSGKTTFIFKRLLPEMIKNKGRLLYLVNRRVLLEQLNAELNSAESELLLDAGVFTGSIDKYITIAMYQSIEKGLLQQDFMSTVNWIKYFDFVVYDECHYFYNDSNFNTYTELSFDCLRTEFNKKVQIFMSATIKNMEDFIKNRWAKSFTSYLLHGEERRYKNYTMEPNYTFVNLIVFNTREEMKQLVLEQGVKDKWLIFTDSIKEGKELKSFLSNELKTSDDKEDQVGFVDASYTHDEEGSRIVDEIAHEKLTSKKILIATAVIDNGISLKDYELRNIVILADSEESFIQMLGRKRPDGEKINLYICRRDSEHFRMRLQHVKNVLSFYKDCAGKLNDIYADTENNNFVFPYHYYYLSYNNVANRTQEQQFRRACNDCMARQRFFERIYASNQEYTYAKKLSYPLCGTVAINSFSVRKYRDLSVFYNHMIRELENDDNAFVKQQAEWLGIEYVNVEQFILESVNQMDKLHRDNIIKCIEKGIDEDKDIEKMDSLLNRPFDQIQNQRMKNILREDLRYFFKKDNSYISDADRRILSDLIKKKRNISCEHFNRCMELAGLPYEMKKDGGSIFVISKVKEMGEKTEESFPL